METNQKEKIQGIKPVSFFESISPFVQLGAESRVKLLSLMRKQELPKGHVLVPAGNICNHVYYLEKGISRTFYIKDCKEVTEEFNAENSFACSMNGYLTKKPDGRQIVLLENSVIWSLPYTDLEKLYDAHHDIERLGRYIITQELVQMHRRLSNLQFMTAKERYSNFTETYPSLMQRLPLGLISSYLGLTQETLSRIRAQV